MIEVRVKVPQKHLEMCCSLRLTIFSGYLQSRADNCQGFKASNMKNLRAKLLNLLDDPAATVAEASLIVSLE